MILANYNMKLSINFDEIIMSEEESNTEKKILLILEFLYLWGKTASVNYLQHSITKLKEQDLTSLLQTMISRNWIESKEHDLGTCLLYTSPSPRDGLLSRMPSSA